MSKAQDSISVRELVTKLHDATERMSRKNGHRILLLHAMSAIMELSNRIDAQKEAEAAAAEKPRVELVTM